MLKKRKKQFKIILQYQKLFKKKGMQLKKKLLLIRNKLMKLLKKSKKKSSQHRYLKKMKIIKRKWPKQKQLKNKINS